MGAGHDHGLGNAKHEGPLWWALGLTSLFLAVEVVGGILTNSLALLSDAAHMATDVAALVIALVAVRLSRRPPDAKRTFGYARLEALGALANGMLLFVVAGFILWEAIARFVTPTPVHASGMLMIALAGLVVNLIAMRLLKAGSGESLNMKGAYLEVWSDMLGSAGVVIGALLIEFTGWLVVDPIIAVLIGLWVLPRTWTLVRAAVNILIEGVPDGVPLAEVRALLEADPDVTGVHDLHLWSLGTHQRAFTVHLVTREDADATALRQRVVAAVESRFAITDATVQIETERCAGDAAHHH